MIGIYNVFQPFDLKGVIFQTKRHTSNWVLFASSSFSYKVKITMLSNGLWPGAYSQLSSTLYGCLYGGSPFPYWPFALSCLVSAWMTPITTYLSSFDSFLSLFLSLVRNTWYKPIIISSTVINDRLTMAMSRSIAIWHILNDRLLKFQIPNISSKLLD